MIDKNKDKDTDTEIKVKESEKLVDSKKKSSEDKTSDVNDINAKPLNEEKAKKNILKKAIIDKNENKVISTDSKKNANGKNDVDLKTSQKKHPKSNSNNKQTKSSSNQNEENEYTPAYQMLTDSASPLLSALRAHWFSLGTLAARAVGRALAFDRHG